MRLLVDWKLANILMQTLTNVQFAQLHATPAKEEKIPNAVNARLIFI